MVLSDISGYSGYLREAELDHARDTLASLIQILIDHTRSPLVLIEIEGDAVFSYAPAGSFNDGQTLIAFVKNTYADFRRALELMVLNTTCRCNACKLLPNLDLKFFIHHGQFVVQEMAGHTKLLGHDVNLLHRVMKNSITKATGIGAYAAYTASVIDSLDLGELAQGLAEHHEAFPDVGELSLYVQDMHRVWESVRESLSLAVKPEEANYVVEQAFPVPPSLLWEYITLPEYRAIIMNSDSQDLTKGGDGLTGPGSTYYCSHGRTVSEHTVLEWMPFEQYTTWESYPLPNTYGKSTYLLQPSEGGTKLRVLGGNITGPPGVLQLARVMVPAVGRRSLNRGLLALKALIERQLAEGQLVIPTQPEVSDDDIREAAAEGLRRDVEASP